MSKSLGQHWVLIAAIGVWSLAAGDVRAEVFSDIYMGAAITGDSEYFENGDEMPMGWACVTGCSSAVSPVGGLRIGYWFERLPWLGVAGDFSAFVAGWGIESPVDVTAFPLSALVAVRGSLVKRKAYPHGRVQPYAALGISLITSRAEDTEGWYDDTIIHSDLSFDVGADARVGAKLMASDWIGVFLEYRYTYFKPSWEIDGNTIETSMSTNHFMLGMALHY